MFEPIYDEISDAVIKVIGVGGGGGNSLNHMVENQDLNSPGGVEFFSVNADAQALRTSSVSQTIQIGAATTKGLGCGGNPNVGCQAALEDKNALEQILKDSDMVFIAAGMGGGTGTGAAPVIAEIAKNMENPALTVAVVTKPFKFEGKRRLAYAEQGIAELSKYVDSLIIIPNDKLLKVLPKNIKMKDAFRAADDVLRNAVLGITEMITIPGVVNLDFADIRTVMSEMGRAMMGIGIAEGDNRALSAVEEAISSPLLEDVDWDNAKGILVSITGGDDLELMEINDIMDRVHEKADPDANIIFGTAESPEMEGKIRVTLVATGIGSPEQVQQKKIQPVATSTPVTAIPQAEQMSGEIRVSNKPHSFDEKTIVRPTSFADLLRK